LFVETHIDPPRAWSDATTMLPLNQTVKLLGELAMLFWAVREGWGRGRQ
jgi:3-deoxy-D-manno-octulosonic acid (KDO) 8-phosphate synthase